MGMPANRAPVIIGCALAEKLTLPTAFTLVDEKRLFSVTFLLVRENKFFTIGANIQVTLIVIYKLIFVKSTLLFATGLGLVNRGLGYRLLQGDLPAP